MRNFFGTDGIRGKANVHPMTAEVALSLGRAVAHHFAAASHKPRIIVGKDTRRSCYMFEHAIAAGIASMGDEALLCGPMPTPAVAYLTAAMRADAGVVISASHNPFYDNGIKIFAGDGFKLPDETELKLEQLIQSDALDGARAASEHVGRVTRIRGVEGRYISFVKHTFPADLSLEGMRIAVDAANGAAYKVAPWTFEELGAQVVALGVQPNGHNINADCGALHPQRLQRAVVEHGCQLGIALDGDADRCIIVDEKGQVVDGDAVMAIIATRMLRADQLNKKTLVVTVMSNLGLQRAIENAGGHVVRTKVGDRYVVDEMRKNGYNLGGEQSGHLVFLDHVTTGDGIMAGLRVLEVMLRDGKPVSELAQVIQRYPQVLVNVNVAEKKQLDSLPDVNQVIAAAEAKLGGEGRVLVRYSGTEAKARIMVEGADEVQIKGMADDIATALQSACGQPQ